MPEQQSSEATRGRFARLLNESQRRSLGVTARRVELAVWRLEDRLTRAEPPALALTRFTNTPSDEQRTALLRLITEVRREIAQIAEDFNLGTGEENFLRSIMGEFTLLWADLEDTRPQKLRRYGAVKPEAAEALGPPIQRLIQLMPAIDHVASGKQTPS